MAGSIRIATWNSNGLKNHILELQVFLETEKIDICLISETHFTNHSNVKVKGYKIYNCIHPSNNARGGASVIIKENIQHFEEPQFCKDHIQAASVRVKTRRYGFTVTSIYSPPRHAITKEEYLEFLNTMGPTFIAGGDWNAKNVYWNSRLTNAKGRNLFEAGLLLNCEFLASPEPSYWPTDNHKIPDVLDFFVAKNIPCNHIEVKSSNDLSSDHTPVILTLSDTIISKPPKATLTNKFTDWGKFKIILEGVINLKVPLKTNDQLEKDVDIFTEQIITAAKECTPERKNVIPGVNYSIEVKEMILEKRRARRKWQHSRHPDDKNVFNRLSQQLKRHLNDLKNEGIGTFLEGLSAEKDTNYNLWKATKRIKRPIQSASPPLRRLDNSWARSNQEKADLHADHLENVFKPHPGQDEEEELIPTMPPNTIIPPVSPKEVGKQIEILNSKKAPGYDMITAEILKQLPPKGIVKLTHLFNAALRLQHVPKKWKIAEIITLLKPGKPPDQVSSYRPISLLPIISKVFEKLILKRLNTIIEEKGLYPSHQFGFRHSHSTIDQVHRITNDIEKALEDKKVCSAIFLDVAQAFDKVWHEGLMYKLKNTLPPSYSNLLQSYLEDRFFRVKQEQEYSSYRKILAGVPQGSVLGPTLYLLFTADVPKDPGTKIATFADDTAILATGINTRYSTMKLQSALNKVSAWTKKWRIHLNHAKSQHVNFTNRRELPIPVKINRQIVPYSNKAKYLGMTLDAKLRWKEHIKIKIKQLKNIEKKMRWLIGRNSRLSESNKLLLYNQVIKPVWTYGIQLWGCSRPTNIAQIQTFQNKILRNVINAPWYIRNSDIHRDLKVPTVTETVASAANRHKQRLQIHANIQVQGLLRLPFRRLQRTKFIDLITSE